jgi:hypothetical protein
LLARITTSRTDAELHRILAECCSIDREEHRRSLQRATTRFAAARGLSLITRGFCRPSWDLGITEPPEWIAPEERDTYSRV